MDQLEEFAGSIGLGEFRSPLSLTAFMAAPIVHQGVRAGTIFVGDDAPGREFTSEDEETLVLFASQAAQVVANARRYRDEQRARADLETLLDISPVGVVVFDAVTGVPRSLNREARRIVDGLRDPDQTPEMLLDVVTFRAGRRAGGVAGRSRAVGPLELGRDHPRRGDRAPGPRWPERHRDPQRHPRPLR